MLRLILAAIGMLTTFCASAFNLARVPITTTLVNGLKDVDPNSQQGQDRLDTRAAR